MHTRSRLGKPVLLGVQDLPVDLVAIVLEPANGLIALAVEELKHEAQRPHVLAAIGLFGTEDDLFYRRESHLRDVDRQQTKAI